MLTIPRKLDIHVAWTSKDVRDPSQWTLELTPEDHDELDTALAHAKAKSSDLLQIDRGDFPLKGLATKLAQVERDLIDGRGFTRISALNTERYDDDDLTMLYWGIGMHLGDPWPQNKHGHVMGDVTDQNKRLDDPTIRGNEIGLIALDYHTDGSDLVGLMCLRAAKSGGLSCVANIVAIYNKMVDDRPDLVAALFEDMPWDYRGEEPAGGKPYYMRNVFTEHDGRLFCRFVPQYIRSSQRHADAPRLSERSLEALEMVTSLANQPD